MVALAVPIYKHKHLLKKYIVEIIIGVTVGSIVAMTTSVGEAKLLGMNVQMMSSLAPRSITTPLALSVSERLGGNPSITAVIVIITGLTGVIISSLLLKWLPSLSPITKGMVLGASAHGTGTSRAHEIGGMEGTIASLTMVFMGIFTTIIAPNFIPYLYIAIQH
jgi:putative effector of murein hydrolase